MDICQYLRDNGISFERYDHEPVFTCEEADRLCIPGDSAKTKNPAIAALRQLIW